MVGGGDGPPEGLTGAGTVPRSAVPLQLRISGEAPVLAVGAVIPPWHHIAFTPECFVQVYLKQEHDVLLISFLELLWLLRIT